jgi:tetratricopeptide (TPR) repeat protein
MRKQVLTGALVVLFLAVATQAQKLGEPKLEPSPSTAAQDELIKQGIALHDQGNYNGAISRYQEVLKENPNNVLALYEMGFSYFEKKDYRRSLEIAYKTAQFKSSLLPRVYVQIGNALDELGDAKKAIETYESGIKLFPGNFLLHFNLAITYNKLGKFDEARTAVKKSAALNPNHPTSNLLLAMLFDRGSYRTPALLAACRFLIFEPKSGRSETALAIIRKSMQTGVSAGTNPNEINIFVDMSAKKDEGDFTTIDLVISMATVAGKTEKNRDKTPMQLLTGSFETVFGVLAESQKSDPSKFTWKYYVPYFVELKKQGHTEAFVYYINQREAPPEVTEWLAQNPDKVAAFLTWSKVYPWPKTD